MPKKTTKTKHPLSLEIQAANYRLIDAKRKKLNEEFPKWLAERYFEPKAIKLAIDDPHIPDDDAHDEDEVTALIFKLLFTPAQNINDVATKIAALSEISVHRFGENLGINENIFRLNAEENFRDTIFAALLRDIVSASKLPSKTKSIEEALECLGRPQEA